MKQLLLTITFLFYSTFASGIDLIVPASSGGTYHKFATIIKKDLESKGIEVKLIVSGNCVIGKKQWTCLKNPTYLCKGQQWQNAVLIL